VNDPRRWLYAARYVNKLVIAVGDIALNLTWRVCTIVTLYYATDWAVFIATTKLR